MIPFLTILAISSASIFEIKLFLSSAARGRIAAFALDLEKLTLGVMITLIPGVSYGIAYYISFDHSLAILIMGGSAFAELAIAGYLLKRSKKDANRSLSHSSMSAGAMGGKPETSLDVVISSVSSVAIKGDLHC